MSVTISHFYPDGSADYLHLPDGEDPTVHQGHWTPAQLMANTAFVTTQRPNGTDQPWLARIGVRCPDCGVVSVHPVGGGAAPRRVQRMFLVMLKGRQANRTWPQAIAIAKSLLATEGAPWVLGDNVTEDDNETDGPGGVRRLSLPGPAGRLPGPRPKRQARGGDPA